MPAEPGAVLVPFDPRHAPLVASWATTPDEVLAWCGREASPVTADDVAAWAAEADVEAWLLAAPGGGPPVAYGELWLDAEAGEVELARLIVDPAERGRGVGRRLAALLGGRALAALPGPPLVALRVLPGNEAAIRAYAAAGFEPVDPATEAAWNVGQRRSWSWMRMA